MVAEEDTPAVLQFASGRDYGAQLALEKNEAVIGVADYRGIRSRGIRFRVSKDHAVFFERIQEASVSASKFRPAASRSFKTRVWAEKFLSVASSLPAYVTLLAQSSDDNVVQLSGADKVDINTLLFTSTSESRVQSNGW